ncbi:MAG: hypothetical protein D6762_06895 [Candidatus Neomarinimicrobiota bacterium]|nr:MAG: hypothetical protein D6762_06895 [Candidatus Neomarinimicrobiota bacterium]
MSKTQFSSLPLSVRILFALDLLLLVLYLINMTLGEPNPWLNRFLDLNDENNLSTWYSSIQLFLVALQSGLAVYGDQIRTNRKQVMLWLLPLLFLFLSLDETAMIHETLGDWSDSLLPGGSRENTPYPVTGIWMLLFGVPFLVGIVLLGMWIDRQMEWTGKLRALFLAGIGVFLGSALGIETLSNWLVSGAGYYAEVSLEEFGELAGGTLLFWFSRELLRSRGMQLLFGDRPQDPGLYT